MYDIERILLEIDKIPKFDNQICLQTVKGCDDPFYGTGRLNNIEHLEEEFIIPLFDIPYINSILDREKMFRSRIMKMNPRTCLSYHIDPTKRKHIPIKTNDCCFFVVNDVVIRMPDEGCVYTLDTTKIHTAINASWEERLHIIGCITTEE